MPRVKLYEHSAKTILSRALNIPYRGVRIDKNCDFKKISAGLAKNKKFVVKVDQGVKKRMKNGLVVLDVSAGEILAAVKKINGGIASPAARNDRVKYDNFLVEEFLPHQANEEKYFSLELERAGIVARVSTQGGIDIENNPQTVKQFLFIPKNFPAIAKITGLTGAFLKKMREFFDKNYFCFLEINPLVVKNNQPYFLDLAATVDSAGEFFVNNISPVIPTAKEESLSKRPRQRSLTIVRDDKNKHTTWSEKDVVATALKTPEEKNVKILKDNSPAALSLAVVNPDGAIFLLLSGGGASLVLADEVANLGAADQLANYGEYSGNPSEEETYRYALEIISLLKKSRAKNKILIIGGGVANFTDVRATFRGIIHALSDNKSALKRMKTKIFVRRGGPGQTEGLASMRKFLTDNNFKGGVYGPELPLQKIVELALNNFRF